MNTENFTATNLAAQRKRILDKLRAVGVEGVTTIQAREELDVMMPAARIFELRHIHNFNIQRINSIDHNAQGNKHQCARYVLLSGKYIDEVA